jgi:STE24 endopeptidase
MTFNAATYVFASMFALQNGFEIVLDQLQSNYLKKRRNRVPDHLKGKVDPETIQKAVDYNLDKLKLAKSARFHGALALWVMILFGFAWLDDMVVGFGLGPIFTGLLFLGILGLLDAAWNLPLDIISIFVVETRHGFNRQRPGGFALDKIKELLIAAVIGAALVSVVLGVMKSAGPWWWLVAFAAVAAIQLVVAWLFPVVLMPLFNRFTPVEKDLEADVGDLAARVGFLLRGVMVMDGSKRSAHSNAFIVGLKGARRIVFFDTLIPKIRRSELLAVLAHELGHFRLGHLRRRMALTASFLFAGFAAMAFVREQSIFYSGLGFERPSDYAFLIVFGLFSVQVLSPLGWFFRHLSRRDEFAADRFAVNAVGNGWDLANALVALTKQNLSSPGSHRLYRSYHNSHPALKHRLNAIRQHALEKKLPVDSPVDPDITEKTKPTNGEEMKTDVQP